MRKTELKYPFPEFTEINREGDCLNASFRIDDSFPFLEGHFPGNPLVPAVIQIGWAVAAVALLREKEIASHRLFRYKFVAPIRPNDAVTVVVQGNENKYQCRVTANGILCSSGNLIVESHD